tara:strand:+ start:1862 stop:2728 length:867 start_codon:yes stop_codon:yes gene_type:complete
MSDRLLITGATGFVGRKVLAGLMQKDVIIRAVVRSGTLAPDGVEEVVRTQDLFRETSEWWTEVCSDVDTVIHLAWYAVPGKYLHALENLACLQGTLQLAEGAIAAGVRRFVGAGTCFEYDLADGYLSIETPLRPSTSYSAAKAAAFLALSQILPKAHIDFAWCRLFYMYGEGEDPRRLAPYLHGQLSLGQPAALTSGRQVRDFLDVAEVGRQISTVVFSELQGAINICSGQPITVRQFAEQIADQYGRRDLLRFGVRPENSLDPACVVGIPTPLPSAGDDFGKARASK